MAINADKRERWDADVRQSVAQYNDWFMRFAPETFRAVRAETRALIARIFAATDQFRRIEGPLILGQPEMVPVLRMCCAPPLAVDRLIGLAGVPDSFVDCLEEGAVPKRMKAADLTRNGAAVAVIISRMLDRELFPWLDRKDAPTAEECAIAIAVLTDRLATSIANPAVRNAQEKRQLDALEAVLQAQGYRAAPWSSDKPLNTMPPGTYAFRMVVVAGKAGENVNIPVDCVIQPKKPRRSGLPILIEAKSAGDFANTNKRWKEEAQKIAHLRARYGPDVEFILLLGGYFGERYLSLEVQEGIDFIWEHRVEDVLQLGL